MQLKESWREVSRAAHVILEVIRPQKGGRITPWVNLISVSFEKITENNPIVRSITWRWIKKNENLSNSNVMIAITVSHGVGKGLSIR